MSRLNRAQLVLALLLPLPAVASPVPGTDPQKLVTANNAFALDLHGRLAKKGAEKNLFVSPYSISTALAMTYAGARGETATQMARTLRFELPPARLHRAFAALIARQNDGGAERGYRLSVANALWPHAGARFLPEFLRLTRTRYRAKAQPLDYSNAEQARQTINRWVEQKTNDKIKDLIPRGAVSGATRLVLTNAIHFKGDWASGFKKDRTRPAPFRLSGGGSVQAPLMHQTGVFGYAQVDPELQVLQLPYKGKEVGMVVLLPQAADGLPALESRLNPARLRGWLSRLAHRKTRVFLPRFKVTSEFSLAKVLQEMGMPVAFSKGADFSGMTGNTTLKISDVIHKAFVDVNEEGTEAAAATAVIMTTKRAAIRRPPVPVFRVDRPFLFLIRDLRSGSILFMGRVVKPS